MSRAEVDELAQYLQLRRGIKLKQESSVQAAIEQRSPHRSIFSTSSGRSPSELAPTSPSLRYSGSVGSPLRINNPDSIDAALHITPASPGLDDNSLFDDIASDSGTRYSEHSGDELDKTGNGTHNDLVAMRVLLRMTMKEKSEVLKQNYHLDQSNKELQLRLQTLERDVNAQALIYQQSNFWRLPMLLQQNSAELVCRRKWRGFSQWKAHTLHQRLQQVLEQQRAFKLKLARKNLLKARSCATRPYFERWKQVNAGTRNHLISNYEKMQVFNRRRMLRKLLRVLQVHRARMSSTRRILALSRRIAVRSGFRRWHHSNLQHMQFGILLYSKFAVFHQLRLLQRRQQECFQRWCLLAAQDRLLSQQRHRKRDILHAVVRKWVNRRQYISLAHWKAFVSGQRQLARAAPLVRALRSKWIASELRVCFRSWHRKAVTSHRALANLIARRLRRIEEGKVRCCFQTWARKAFFYRRHSVVLHGLHRCEELLQAHIHRKLDLHRCFDRWTHVIRVVAMQQLHRSAMEDLEATVQKARSHLLAESKSKKALYQQLKSLDCSTRASVRRYCLSGPLIRVIKKLQVRLSGAFHSWRLYTVQLRLSQQLQLSQQSQLRRRMKVIVRNIYYCKMRQCFQVLKHCNDLCSREQNVATKAIRGTLRRAFLKWRKCMLQGVLRLQVLRRFSRMFGRKQLGLGFAKWKVTVQRVAAHAKVLLRFWQHHRKLLLRQAFQWLKRQSTDMREQCLTNANRALAAVVTLQDKHIVMQRWKGFVHWRRRLKARVRGVILQCKYFRQMKSCFDKLRLVSLQQRCFERSLLLLHRHHLTLLSAVVAIWKQHSMSSLLQALRVSNMTLQQCNARISELLFDIKSLEEVHSTSESTALTRKKQLLHRLADLRQSQLQSALLQRVWQEWRSSVGRLMRTKRILRRLLHGVDVKLKVLCIDVTRAKFQHWKELARRSVLTHKEQLLHQAELNCSLLVARFKELVAQSARSRLSSVLGAREKRMQQNALRRWRRFCRCCVGTLQKSFSAWLRTLDLVRTRRKVLRRLVHNNAHFFLFDAFRRWKRKEVVAKSFSHLVYRCQHFTRALTRIFFHRLKARCRRLTVVLDKLRRAAQIVRRSWRVQLHHSFYIWKHANNLIKFRLILLRSVVVRRCERLTQALKAHFLVWKSTVSARQKLTELLVTRALQNPNKLMNYFQRWHRSSRTVRVLADRNLLVDSLQQMQRSQRFMWRAKISSNQSKLVVLTAIELLEELFRRRVTCEVYSLPTSSSNVLHQVRASKAHERTADSASARFVGGDSFFASRDWDGDQHTLSHSAADSNYFPGNARPSEFTTRLASMSASTSHLEQDSPLFPDSPASRLHSPRAGISVVSSPVSTTHPGRDGSGRYLELRHLDSMRPLNTDAAPRSLRFNDSTLPGPGNLRSRSADVNSPRSANLGVHYSDEGRSSFLVGEGSIGQCAAAKCCYIEYRSVPTNNQIEFEISSAVLPLLHGDNTDSSDHIAYHLVGVLRLAFSHRSGQTARPSSHDRRVVQVPFGQFSSSRHGHGHGGDVVEYLSKICVDLRFDTTGTFKFVHTVLQLTELLYEYQLHSDDTSVTSEIGLQENYTKLKHELRLLSDQMSLSEHNVQQWTERWQQQEDLRQQALRRSDRLQLELKELTDRNEELERDGETLATKLIELERKIRTHDKQQREVARLNQVMRNVASSSLG